jgi:AraC-like DNA-binding protein
MNRQMRENRFAHASRPASARPDAGALPPRLIAGDLARWVRLPRLATRERLVPVRVQTTVEIPGSAVYEDFFGVRLTRSDVDGVTFSTKDALRPFLTASEAMWSIFEPELRHRMADLDRHATTSEKVRASLTETLASGRYRLDDVASRLAVSPRTLQRRLRTEGTTFQQVLDAVRQDLAGSYLARSDFSNDQIAFLLGYEDPSSFFRAFRAWTGRTPEASRALASR